jgi:flagellar biosynthesis protein FlhG
MGMSPPYNLQHVLAGEKTMREIIVPGPGGVQVISGGSGLADLANLSDPQRDSLISGLADLEGMADVLLVDTGAGIGPNVLQFILAAQELIIVTTPDPTAITDAYSLIKVVSRLSSEVPVKLLVNQVRTAEEAEEIKTKIIGVAKKFLHLDVGSYGSLPYDNNLIKAVRQQMPVIMAYPNSPSSYAFYTLAARLWNEDAPINNNKPGLLNFFRRIVRPADWGGLADG